MFGSRRVGADGLVVGAVIRDIALLVSAEGLRVVLQALTDGPHDISPLLAMGFLWVMDRPGTRQFLRPGVDVEVRRLSPASRRSRQS